MSNSEQHRDDTYVIKSSSCIAVVKEANSIGFEYIASSADMMLRLMSTCVLKAERDDLPSISAKRMSID